MTTEFRPDRPEPGSLWARYCPEAWPREWLVRGRMPDGFTRPATPDEADLITGRISERLFLWRTGRLTNPSPRADTDAASGRTRDRNRKPARRGRSAKRNALVERVLGYRRFFNTMTALDEPLSVGAVAVWCWLWTCAKAGRAKLTTRKLAQRFRVGQSTATRWTGELARVGLIETLRRGKPGRSATIVRVRYSPDTKPDGQP